MRKIKIFLIPILLGIIFIFTLNYLNLIPEPSHKPQAMFLLKPFYEKWKEKNKEYGYKREGFSSSTPGYNSINGESDSVDITATSIVDGRTIPYGESGSGPTMIISEVSDDKTYGYTPDNPVKVGGFSEKKGSANEMRYLNSLYGHDGEIIEYERLGSCCPFSTPNVTFGLGLLDKYRITYKGLKKPIFLYLNMYDYEKSKAPYGFSINAYADRK